MKGIFDRHDVNSSCVNDDVSIKGREQEGWPVSELYLNPGQLIEMYDDFTHRHEPCEALWPDDGEMRLTLL
jgi:hypothetical protein